MQTLSNDLLSGADAASEYTGGIISPRAVYRMAASGQLPVVKKGRKLFFRKSDLERTFQSEAVAA